MHLFKRYIFCLLAMLLMIAESKADEGNQFSSDLLRQAVASLKIQQAIDSLPDGSTIQTIPSAGSIRVAKREGRLVHLGRPLFANELYQQALPIYNYLEFALLDHQTHISDNPFLYRHLKFKEGGWDLLEQVTPQTACTVSSVQGSSYEVCWTFSDGRRVRIEVPVEYDRLALMSRREIEQLFLNEMQSYLAPEPAALLPLDKKTLKQIDGNLWEQPGSYYILSAINQNTYYTKQDDALVLVCDSIHPAETVANIINANSEELPMPTVSLLFDLYDFKSASLRMALTDFLSFCRKQGCTPYWGLESVNGSMIEGSIYLDNPTSGYNHVLHLRIDVAQLIESSAKMDAKVSLFIPTNTIENLFKEYVPRESKNKDLW